MNNKIEDKLIEIVTSDGYKKNELMSNHTTFKVGGPADYFVTPKNTEELQKLVKMCKDENVSYFVMGNGSNLLVGDKGIRGIVIEICSQMNQIKTEDDKMTVQAGALLSKVAFEALENDLEGFEFASGIPGTFGGAVVMNAGAYGGEIKQVLESATVMTTEGEVKVLLNEELELDYRTSCIPQNEYIVLEGVLKLKKGSAQEIKACMNQLKEQRVSKQPLEFPSAGSTFKRPEGHFAGKLIMDAELRGYSIGGAQVSQKHCGFLINKGNATAKDIINLIEYVQKQVYNKYGVSLETEVKRVGEF